MARHATPSAFSSGSPTSGTRDRRRRSSPRPARSSVSTSGRILVAAVAAGAALPAVQTLGTHIADADATSAADLSLAASTGPAVRQATHTAPPATSAATTGAPRAGWSAVTPVVADADRTSRSSGTSSGASAGDASDVSSLTKAMGMARENGPLEFGRPYTAGDEESLDGQIDKALGLMGLPQKLAPGVKKIIMRESTGKADAVNDWDSNAAAGTPSKGLMQLIDTTFENAVLPSLEDEGIFDPVANITAGVRTMIANHSIDDVMAGGLKNSSGDYIGYGGAKLPDDGLG